MRLTAIIKQQDSEIKRLMIYNSEDGVYLFEYDTDEDSSALCDYWFENIEDALESCYDDFGVEKSDWKQIPDPMEDCQHDWIEPVRVIGCESGNPEWGRFEKLINDVWIEIQA